MTIFAPQSRMVGLGSLCVVLLAAACGEPPAQPKPDIRSFARQARVRDALVTASASRGFGIDRELVAIGDSVPGFGGYYFDVEFRALTVLLKDLCEADHARQFIRGRTTNARFLEAEMSFRTAAFSWRDLVTWKEALFLALPSAAPSFSFVDADESQNRVVVGVADLRDRVAVMSFISQAGIPPEAVVLRYAPLVIPTTKSITARHRPVTGGLAVQLSLSTNSFSSCTVAWNWLRNGQTRVDGVTASHCTATPYFPDAPFVSSVYQSTAFTSADYLGAEFLDPAGCGPGT